MVLTTVADSVCYSFSYTSLVCYVIAAVIFTKTLERFGNSYINYLKEHPDSADFLDYCGDAV
jgi:hypothetical protein